MKHLERGFGTAFLAGVASQLPDSDSQTQVNAILPQNTGVAALLSLGFSPLLRISLVPTHYEAWPASRYCANRTLLPRFPGFHRVAFGTFWGITRKDMPFTAQLSNKKHDPRSATAARKEVHFVSRTMNFQFHGFAATYPACGAIMAIECFAALICSLHSARRIRVAPLHLMRTYKGVLPQLLGQVGHVSSICSPRNK